MVPSITYRELISNLDRDVERHIPSDPLRFCFKWFQARLEVEREERFNASASVGQNALGFKQMGRSNFKRSFDGFNLLGDSSTIIVDDASSSTFNGKRRRMGIHGEPMNFHELQLVSPCSSTSPTLEDPSTPVNPTSSTSPVTLPLSPGSRRASDASIASKDYQHRRASHLTTPPLSPPTIPSDSELSSSSDSHDSRNRSKYLSSPNISTSYISDRRTSVSSESLTPTPNSASSDLPIYPKSQNARNRIEAAIGGNILFRNLHEDQVNDILNAIQEIKIEKGTEVILQGGHGESFYIVASGSFEAWIRGPTSYTYISPGKSERTLGKLSRAASYGPGESFGELALMYNAPRAATVVATSTSSLYSLDRVSFRRILMEHTNRKRKMYENFLAELPFLANLNIKERSKIAETLDERVVEEGRAILKEGNDGKFFFLIGSGKVEVSRKRAGRVDEILGTLCKGEYFGGTSIDI